MNFNNTDLESINCIRGLSIDAVEKANSGHPGMPLGTAPLAYVLWKHFLRFNPQKPDWLNRDRFILSAGHGSMLLYSLLHLYGFDLTLEEIKNFRQLGSKTAGHPEFGLTSGVEVTTGPLGQGIANGVGLAIAQKYLAAFFNTPENKIIDYNVFILAGDGCLQEGISHESCSLASHLGLDNLVLIHDNNHITIDGSTAISTNDNQIQFFQSKGWETIEVKGDGNDLDAIFSGLQKAINIKNAPVFLSIETCIGYGSPNKAGSEKSHGSPLGESELALTKKKLNLDPEKKFQIPKQVAENFQKIAGKKKEAEKIWQDNLTEYKKKNPEKYQLFKNPLNFQKLQSCVEAIKFDMLYQEGKNISTRAASGLVLDSLMPDFPLVLGGSADLTGSNNTKFQGADVFCKTDYKARYINYGIREHAMAGVINGITRSELVKAYGGTFLCFSDYMRPAIRLAALSHYPSIFVFSHDSIGLGEDGPTHQPVEHLAALRAIPNLLVIRPADANETKYTWLEALQSKIPVALILSRQNLPVLKNNKEATKGGYIFSDSPNAEYILIATGSELQLAIEAAEILCKKNIPTRVVSMPCWELFEKQPAAYRETVFPSCIKKRIAIEAGIKQGWERYLGEQGKFIGMDSFGASAPADKLFEYYGITVEKIVELANSE